MTRENFDWLKDLKVGDEVAVDISSRFFRANYKTCKVVRITPTGIIKLSDDTQYRADGREVGNHYSYPLRQITPQIIDAIERRQLLQRIDFDKFKDSLSTERLRMIAEWQKEVLDK